MTMVICQRIFQAIVLSGLLLGSPSFAASDCSEVFSGNPASSEIATSLVALEPYFSTLRSLHIRERTRLGVQSHYGNEIDPDGGGACATVSAFNLLQVLRLATNHPVLEAESVVRRIYRDLPELKAGRVSNEEMLTLLDYFKTYLDGHSPEVRIDQSTEHLRKWQDGSLNNSHTWRKFNRRLLRLTKGAVKIVVYQVSSGGKVLGRHFVLLEEGLGRASKANLVTVMDPNKPDKQFTYEVVVDPNDPGIVRLQRPGGGSPRDWILTLDTVFTVKVP